MTALSNYEFSTDLSRIDWPRVQTWLASSYWTPGIPMDRVKRAAENSALVLGAYKDGIQVGYLRVVSDRTRFAYLCDVWVESAHRGRGLARQMVQTVLDHPDLKTCNWLLATQDAHGVYAPLGFAPLPVPARFMVKGTIGAASNPTAPA